MDHREECGQLSVPEKRRANNYCGRGRLGSASSGADLPVNSRWSVPEEALGEKTSLRHVRVDVDVAAGSGLHLVVYSHRER